MTQSKDVDVKQLTLFNEKHLINENPTKEYKNGINNNNLTWFSHDSSVKKMSSQRLRATKRGIEIGSLMDFNNDGSAQY